MLLPIWQCHFSIPFLSPESLQARKTFLVQLSSCIFHQEFHVYSEPFQFLINHVTLHDVLQWFPVCISYLSNEIISSFMTRNSTIFLSIHYSTKQQRGILINTVLNWIKYIEPASYFSKFVDQAGHQRLLYIFYVILSTSCCWTQQLLLLLNISSLYLQSMDSMTQILSKCVYKNMKNYGHMSPNLWLHVQSVWYMVSCDLGNAV